MRSTILYIQTHVYTVVFEEESVTRLQLFLCFRETYLSFTQDVLFTCMTRLTNKMRLYEIKH